jgi:protein-S-isoprenylcysteine O-methyltransferase Ste14
VFRLKLILRLAIVLAIVGGILFAAAGRIDLPFFWAYLAVFAGFGGVALLTVSPELIEERRRPAEAGRDNLALLRLVAILVFVSQWIFAGVDVGRFHWSDTVPPALRVAGLASLAAVFAVWYWAMRTNPFFSSAVRIQHDRGHRVVSSGPYRFVRHPGYAALVLLGWGGALALGSWYALLPHVVVVALFVHRAALEDRMLREELDGYAAYAATVRSRIFPGIW